MKKGDKKDKSFELGTSKSQKKKLAVDDPFRAQNQMDGKGQRREAKNQNLQEQLDLNTTKLETYPKLRKSSKERLQEICL